MTPGRKNPEPGVDNPGVVNPFWTPDPILWCHIFQDPNRYKIIRIMLTNSSAIHTYFYWKSPSCLRQSMEPLVGSGEVICHLCYGLWGPSHEPGPWGPRRQWRPILGLRAPSWACSEVWPIASPPWVIFQDPGPPGGLSGPFLFEPNPNPQTKPSNQPLT